MSVLDNGLKEKSIELIEKRLLYCHGTFFLPHLQFRLFQIKREKSELYLLVQEKSTASNKNVSWKSIKILNCCALIYSNFKITYLYKKSDLINWLTINYDGKINGKLQR